MRKLYFITLIILLHSCEKGERLFVNVPSERSKINFNNVLKNNKDLNILSYLYYYNGAGVAAGDFNNDSLIDLYFVGNQVADKLYINKGNFSFKDVTKTAGIENLDEWSTGVTTIDINNDGLLDIYICKVGHHNKIKGHNLLYVNQGVIDGVPKFKEQSQEYGLNFSGYSTQSVFFDYDLDGDLDMYLLNHSVHPNSNYGNGNKRTEVDLKSGDRFFENLGGKFIDASKQSGIFQGSIGYGLGISISDVNNDGYPDIYVGNDFFENDYLYINQKDKSFKELISFDEKKIGHTTHFSMGNNISDINNDGFTDIISLDMLPEDLKTYKTSGLEYPYQIYQQYIKNDYAYQYMQNTLHLNLGNENFSETAFLSGIAATEWSWSPLVADFDNDGYKDLYITNGIPGATNDMDFINFISNDKIQNRLGKNMSDDDLKLIKELPEKKTKNYFFKNNGDNTFKDVSDKWIHNQKSFSNGAVYADLDDDGDLDIVVNNISDKAFIFENKTNLSDRRSNYLKVKFKGSDRNKFGIGAKVMLFTDKGLITAENFNSRGYLSSIDPSLHFGLGNVERLDSLQIIWPGGAYQTIKEVEVNKNIQVKYKNASANYYKIFNVYQNGSILNSDPLFDFTHKDQSTLEFNRNPLIPYATTNNGPNISICDINNDDLEDVFITGGKTQSSQLFLQDPNNKFLKSQENIFQQDAINEDISSVFFDANNDGFKDLIVVSGGNEFTKGKPLQPRLYRNVKGNFIKDTVEFRNVEINASNVTTVDVDNDGFLDLCITSDAVPHKFGITPRQYIFRNNGKGNFTDITDDFASQFKELGNIKDLVWLDINNDNLMDAVIVGHWMPISIFINNGEELILQKNNSLNMSNGLWNTVKARDFDNDGDIDIIAGNWGLNTRLTASADKPLTLYSNDFDNNNTIDPIITYFYKGEETTLASKDELVKQIPSLNKKYLSYANFAKAKFSEIFSQKQIKQSYKKQVFELATCYFENIGNNNFKKHNLPFMTQVSSLNNILIDDFNNDNFLDALLTGNNYEINTHLSRFDASHGILLLNDKKGFFNEAKNQTFDISGPSRNSVKIRVKNQQYYIITINNNKPVFLIKNN